MIGQNGIAHSRCLPCLYVRGDSTLLVKRRGALLTSGLHIYASHTKDSRAFPEACERGIR